MRTRVLLVAAVLALAGCSDDGSGDEPPDADASDTSRAPATAERLPTGKDDLELDAVDYFSPDGFAPELELALGSGLTGWISVHRDADAFDLGQPNPDADAPLVVVAFLVPPEDNAAEALGAVRRQAVDAGAKVSDDPGPFGALAESGIDIRDGEGQVVASRDAGIALDAMPGARLQVWTADHGTDPVLIVAFTPDATLSAEADAFVQQLAASVTLTS